MLLNFSVTTFRRLPALTCAKGAPSARSPGRPLHSCVQAMSVQGQEGDKAKQCASVCSRDTPLATDTEIQEQMAKLPAWRLSPDRKAISRSFVAKNFTAAVAFFGRVAEVANAMGHHPDLHLTNYRDVRVDVTTHAIGGLSLADFALAGKLDEVPVDYSPRWLEKQQQQVQQQAQQAQQAQQ